LLIYPFVLIASYFSLPGAAVLGVISALLGLYTLFRGLGLEAVVDDVAERARSGLYAGRVTLITYVVAVALLVVGGAQGIETLERVRGSAGAALPALATISALVYGAVPWFAAAGITSSLGQVTDEYLADRFQWRYLNAPFYVVAIAIVLYALSGFFITEVFFQHPLPAIPQISRTDLALALTSGTLLGVLSTLTFAIAESRYPTTPDPA
jgi:putative membrane protein